MTPQSIDELITRLVREAPALDADVIEELRGALWQVGSPLALAIARVAELVGEQLVDPGIALPALAEACATLGSSTDRAVLEAARFQVDTLLPVPDREPGPAPGEQHRRMAVRSDRPQIAAPDVPLAQLRRK